MKNIQSRREFLASAGKIFGGAAMMTIASPLLTAGGALAENVPEKPAHPFPYVELDPAAAQKAAYEGYFGHYIKYAMREAMDIATTGCSVNVKLSADKTTIEDVRIAYGVAGPVPMRAPTAEAVTRGKAVSAETVEAFGAAVLQDINPRDSWRAAKAFRQHIAVELAKRCLRESIKLAGGEIR